MDGHSERVHRKYSPSQAERVQGCYGSTNLLKRTTARPSSPYAIEGTKAHEVLEAALLNSVRDAETAHREYSSLCCEDLNTNENLFYFAVNMALNHIYSLLDEYPDAVLFTECFVDVPSEVAPGEAGGFCDVAVWGPSIATLFVIDYKHGAGIAKSAKGNPQPLQYAAGFMFQENPLVDPSLVNTVVLTIVQPRAFHPEGPVREHELTPYEVYEYLSVMDHAIAENEKPDAPLTPDDNGKTTDHCRFCDANAECPAREALAFKSVVPAFRTVKDLAPPSIPFAWDLDHDRLAYIAKMAPLVRSFLDDVDQRIEELLRDGHYVHGKKLVVASERRKYYGDEEDVAKKAAALIGCDVDKVMQKKLLPITTLEKMIVDAFKKRVGRGRKKIAAAEAAQSFAFLTLKQSSGNLVVVDEDDPRPAQNSTKSAFGQITGLLPSPPTSQD